MSELTIGELFAGYGGLGMGVKQAIGGRIAWVSDVDPGANKILAHRFPDAPNLGDITTVDWTQVEPVDVITGGSPCQDVSNAGKRAGMKAGTRSGLWAAMSDAIDIIRPRLVVWENVRGALSAEADGGTRNGHELCLCGRSDRRRGLHTSGRIGWGVRTKGECGDDGAGAASTEGTQDGVGRDFVSTEGRDGPLGIRLDVAPHGTEGSEPTQGDPSLPPTEGQAGRLSDQGRGDPGSPGEEGQRAGEVDPRGEGGLRDDQGSDARHERQGSACSCATCGGCVDEGNCQLEPCPGCVGDGDDGAVLRALGRVLGDLADIGYDAGWVGLRAADVGACHGRFRVFVVAWPATDTDILGHERGRPARNGRPGPADSGLGAVTLLPTPAVNDMGAGKTVDAWDAWTSAMQAKHGNGNGHGPSLSIEALRLLPTPDVAMSMGGHERRGGARGDELLLPGVAKEMHRDALMPTPRATDGTKGGPNQRGSSGDLMLPSAVALLATPRAQHGEPRNQNVWARDPSQPQNLENQLADLDGSRFGRYAHAIARHEAMLGRPAPDPTEPTGKAGAHRLSPRFVEFMMCLPDGWVTDTPGITRNEALKALGNGVVPVQAAEAVRWVLAHVQSERAA